GDIGARLAVSRRYVSEALKVEHDETKYEALARRYAQAGDALAEFDYGLRCYVRAQTKQDYAVALRWLEQAAEHGVPEAHEYIGLVQFYGFTGTQDFVKARASLEIAAQQGKPEAQYRLALLHRQG